MSWLSCLSRAMGEEGKAARWALRRDEGFQAFRTRVLLDEIRGLILFGILAWLSLYCFPFFVREVWGMLMFFVLLFGSMALALDSKVQEQKWIEADKKVKKK